MKARHMAFPSDTTNLAEFERGLTKRELIAAMLMQGLVAKHGYETGARHIALEAVTLADALIEELSK